MIQDDSEFLQCLQQLERMHRALATLHREVAPLNQRNYRLLAEGPIDEIYRLRHEIDEYLGIIDNSAAAASA